MINTLPSHSPAPKTVGAGLAVSERDFYDSYSWCVNAFPTIREITQHLRGEIDRLERTETDWPQREVATNIYLLSCAISDTIDDYLLGTRYDFSTISDFLPVAGRLIVKAFQPIDAQQRNFRSWRLGPLRRWRRAWEEAVNEFLRSFLSGRTTITPSERLTSLLAADFPRELLRRRPKVPAAFRSQDLTHFDILMLGEKFITAHPERSQPILVLGLRTAGSYFAPLLRAYLEEKGYSDVDATTIRPKKGIGRHDRAKIANCAARGGLALIVDEPVNTGDTMLKGVKLLKDAGVAADRIVALFPVHPSRRDWVRESPVGLPQSVQVVKLEPEEWYKVLLLEPTVAEKRLSDYLAHDPCWTVSVTGSETEQQCNAELRSLSEEKFHNRLKRVYEVRLEKGAGATETRYVLAKSVGWGWLSYHSFIAGGRLSSFVPPILGLREGILYTQWDRRGPISAAETDRQSVLRIAPAYVAARVRSLGLPEDPSPDLATNENKHMASEELAAVLARAYGSRIPARLKRNRIQRKLLRRRCPVPCLTDSKMRPVEWISTSCGIRKTDFEHHGMGKIELNVTDPAYDLAEVILHWKLSPSEELQLVKDYINESGDNGVQDRLFQNKLLAGAHSVRQEIANLEDARLLDRHPEFCQRYLEAWNFLTLQTMRFCAALCQRPKTAVWRSPLVVLDVDGVLDKQIFGFPSTTAAGVEAVSLLHAHDFAVVLNTARAASELKDYCQAYHFLGGAAEYGSYVWDAATGGERILVSDEALSQLERVRSNLRRIPGVFLNDGYQYSLKAFCFERGVTVPLPAMLIRGLLTRCRADRLTFHQTFTDTTVIAKEANKGRGLLELLAMTGKSSLETIAVGDTESDLAMFRVASRSFAPGNITCRPAAKLLGCRIVGQRYQRGLREIVRSLAHPEGKHCEQCAFGERPWHNSDDLFLRLLAAADRRPAVLLLQVLLDPMALGAFRH